MVNPKIVDAAEVRRQPRKAPATRMIEALPPGYLTAREVADVFGVNIETIRRLARKTDADGNDKFRAPSNAAQSGELIIWLYNEDDVKELAEYFGKRFPLDTKKIAKKIARGGTKKG